MLCVESPIDPLTDLGEKVRRWGEIKSTFRFLKKLIETRSDHAKSLIHLILPIEDIKELEK